jgi:uncharacterized protein (TIGR02598 family)
MRLSSQPRKTPESRPAKRCAFTLIEIAIALGIVSFAVVGLIGVLSVSFDTSRASNQDTIIASMARQVSAELREQPFANLTPGSQKAIYFDNDAHRLESSEGAVYVCAPTLTENPAYTISGTGGATPQPNLYQLQMDFSFVQVVGKPPLQTIYSAIARYD